MISRGSIYWVSFEGAVGAEIQKTRPAVVISNNACNFYLRTVTVVPLTSRAQRVFSFEVAVPEKVVGDGRPCKARTHQLKAVDKSRLRARMGQMPEEVMRKIDESLRTHLGL